VIELPDHPWYLGCQFHPELKSRPTRPHPLFASFVEAAYRHKSGKLEQVAVEGSRVQVGN
jgi:CTP synthase